MPNFSALVENSVAGHRVEVRTGANTQQVAIAGRSGGKGSSVNGAELLLLALATCYCNDLYREAAQRNIDVASVRVEASGNFDGVSGHPVTAITYRVEITSDAAQDTLQELARITDSLAEIHNTLRQGASVTLDQVTIHEA